MGRKSGMGAAGVLVTVVLGIVFFVVIYSLVPNIGFTAETMAPGGDAHIAGVLGKSGAWNYSAWNVSSNQALVNASEIWTGFSGLPLLGIIAIIYAAVIGAFLLLGRY